MIFAPPLFNRTNTKQKLKQYEDYLDMLKREAVTIDQLIPLKADSPVEDSVAMLELKIEVIRLEKKLVDLQGEIIAKMQYISAYKEKLKREEPMMEKLKAESDMFLEKQMGEAAKIIKKQKYPNLKALVSILSELEKYTKDDNYGANENLPRKTQIALGYEMLKNELNDIKKFNERP